MSIAVGLMVIIVLFLLAGVLPVPDGDPGIVFRTPMFIALLAALGIVLLVRTIQQLRYLRIGFILTHGGVVLLLLGAGLGFLFGKNAEFSVPVGSAQGITQIPAVQTNLMYTLPFAIGVSDFRVEYYDPCYSLFRPAAGMPPHRYVRTVAVPTSDTLDLGEAGTIPVAALRDAQGAWRERHVLDNGWFLRLRRTPKHFAAVLQLQVGQAAPRTATLAVNHPVTFMGWTFHLMSYDNEGGMRVHLGARRDPGRRLVIGGIWMIIVGTALLCWRRTAPRMPAPAREEN